MIINAAKAQEAATVLGVELSSLTSDAIGKAYRSRAKDCHPDYHGTDKLEQWSRIGWAKECLEHYVKNRAPEPQYVVDGEECRSCVGKGRVFLKPRGFGAPLTTMCVMCGGTGRLG